MIGVLMKPLTCAVVATLLLAASLDGATHWQVVAADVDETIADTSHGPGTPAVQPLLTEVPFKNFRYPHVDAHENVTFIADDPAFNAGTKHHGIYRSTPGPSGSFRALVRKGDVAVVSLGARFSWFRGLQVDGADFVFNATDNADGRGIYHWSKGRLQLIARSGLTVLPSVKEPLNDVLYGALSNGRILYNATTDSESLLVMHDLRTGTARVLYRSGMPLPGSRAGVLRYMSPQNWMDGGNILFRAADVDQPNAGAAMREGRRGIYGWLGIDWEQPERSLAPERLITLADARTPVPLLSRATFTDFRSAPVRHGIVAFAAGGPTFRGIYFVDLVHGARAVRPIVDTDSALPGVFEGNFKSFDKFCSVFDKSVVFVGRAARGYVGVFLYRTDLDELFLLCDNRTRIGPQRARDFEIAGDFLVRNRFAITATFPDGSSGVYLATIPAESYRRINH